jgi:hypothetical protein
MAPKIDTASDAYLMLRYDEMYNGSNEFKTRLHNVVTSSRGLLLTLNPGPGGARYNPSNNSITVCRQDGNGGGNKPDTRVRDELFFELHNAKKSMALSELQGPKGYNVQSLRDDVKKAAGYAMAVEWTEWVNAAESTILVYVVNNQAGTNLLSHPPVFRPEFDPGADSWRDFKNYLRTQVSGGHTAEYDAAATDDRWKGYAILRAVAGRESANLTIVENEIAPTPPQQPHINPRYNPFRWDLVAKLDLQRY